jgi:hypothetical protein
MALLVVPVVQDVLHEVAVGADRHVVDEATTPHLAARGHRGGGDEAALRRRRDHLRLVVQHAAQVAVAGEMVASR